MSFEGYRKGIDGCAKPGIVCAQCYSTEDEVRKGSLMLSGHFRVPCYIAGYLDSAHSEEGSRSALEKLVEPWLQ